jgi:hypothetical protein
VISAIARSDAKELLGDQRGDLVAAWLVEGDRRRLAPGALERLAAG